MIKLKIDIKDRLSHIIPEKLHFIEGFNEIPEDAVITEIKHSPARYIILTTGDPWYRDYYSNLLCIMQESQKIFFLVTLDYENYSIFSNVHVISFPRWYWARGTSNLKFKDRSSHYGFSCLNKKINAHRMLLGITLWKRNLLDQIIYTQDVERCEILGHALDLIHNRDSDNIFQSLLPIRYGESMDQSIPIDYSINHPAYHDAYCNIVTETSIEYFNFKYFIPAPGVTEKSYKPFLSCQIPIFFAAPGHYQYWKKLGFEVMEDFIGYEFDQAMVTRKCELISDVIALGRKHAEDYYFAHLREIEHNHRLVNSDKIENMILDDIDNFVTNLL